MNKEEYYGVYDYKESDTFRPTQEQRIHKDYPYSKTLCTRSDSCCVIFSGGGKSLMEEKKELEEAYKEYANGGDIGELLKKGTEYQEKHKLRIRKLTPKECLRLMGLSDNDIKLISEHQTKATLYHLAGDSIVCQVLMALMCSFFNKNWEDYFKPEEMWNEDNT